jgi:hypothetical protein
MECTLTTNRVRRSRAGRAGAMCVALSAALAVALSVQAFAAAPEKVSQMPDVATYAGKIIPASEVFPKALSCNFGPDGLACFDTQADARAVWSEAALACTPMQLFDGINQGGGSINITLSGWSDLGVFSNKVSSWKTGSCMRGELWDVPTGDHHSRAASTVAENVPAFINNRADRVLRG